MLQSLLFRWKYILHLIWKSSSQSLEEEWRGTESMLLEVQCKVSTVGDDLGCHVICWCWSTVFSEVHSQRSHLPGNVRALHASFCWQALWRCWFHSTQTDIFQVFIYFNFDDYNWQLMKTPNSVSQKIRILLKTNTKKGFLKILANWKVWTWKVWACTALNT